LYLFIGHRAILTLRIPVGRKVFFCFFEGSILIVEAEVSLFWTWLVLCSKWRQKKRQSPNIFGIETETQRFVCYTQACDIYLTKYFPLLSFVAQKLWDWVFILFRLFKDFDKILSK
jgi:hypothetical protein